jgi:hypothetical protein
MLKLKILLRVVGVIQIILGVMYLVAPAMFLEALGHTIPKADIFYVLGMLSARFIAYGIAFIYISGEPLKHTLWIYFMILIQAIDLGAGIFYTSTGVVTLELSGFAMFNASWIIILLYLFTTQAKAKN